MTNYNINTSTPWGKADTATYYGRGIVFYTTPGHGGFHVSKGLVAKMPWYLVEADKYADGTKGWFEEDVAYSLVVLAFPERFDAKMLEDARLTASHYYPEAYRKWQIGRGEVTP